MTPKDFESYSKVRFAIAIAMHPDLFDLDHKNFAEDTISIFLQTQEGLDDSVRQMLTNCRDILKELREGK